MFEKHLQLCVLGFREEKVLNTKPLRHKKTPTPKTPEPLSPSPPLRGDLGGLGLILRIFMIIFKLSPRYVPQMYPDFFWWLVTSYLYLHP
jgi:hypothetical protein